jgi:hypothetical protein
MWPNDVEEGRMNLIIGNNLGASRKASGFGELFWRGM